MKASPVWDALLPAALVGTQRHGGAWPAWPGEVGALLAQLAPSDAAQWPTAVLRAAAVIGGAAQAGVQGAPWDAASTPAAAAADSLPPPPPGPLHTALAWAFQDGPQRLHHLACLALAEAGHVLPPALLPSALEQGRRSIALRAPLHPVLGERGWWLARQRDAWSFAAAASERDTPQEAWWSDGSLEQRCAFLARERARDPAAARERLAAALPGLPAKERAELLPVLLPGLGPGDEALLERLRGDRSKEVRQAALKLLLNLPGAAHPRRAAARVEKLLTHERGLLRKRWVVDAPTAAADDWAADQVEAARPDHDPLGERAWWLFQLARQVPLPWWTAHTGMPPAELLAWAAQTDWAPSLCRAWLDALLAAPEPAWCEAFLDAWPSHLRDDTAAVLALLPLAQRERHWERQWRGGQLGLVALSHQVLQACAPGELLPPSLSLALAEAVVQRAADKTLSDDHSLRWLLPELACTLHGAALPTLARMPRHAEETASFAENLGLVAQVVAARQALQSLMNTTPPTTRSP